MSDDVAWLQIYGQSYWHMPAEICGDRFALAKIRGFLDEILSGEEKEMKFVAFASDGEGYELSIKLVS